MAFSVGANLVVMLVARNSKNQWHTSRINIHKSKNKVNSPSSVPLLYYTIAHVSSLASYLESHLRRKCSREGQGT